MVFRCSVVGKTDALCELSPQLLLRPGGGVGPCMGRGPRAACPTAGASQSGNERGPILAVPSLPVPAAWYLPSPHPSLPVLLYNTLIPGSLPNPLRFPIQYTIKASASLGVCPFPLWCHNRRRREDEVIANMDRILRGIMKYRHTDRIRMVEQFEIVRNRPEPKAVFFTCMDSRMIPTRFTETNVGDMFVVRNAGNIIPHSQHFLDEVTMNEPAALELGCIVNDIRHIIVCGHSDCKAMNLLHSMQCQEFSSQQNRRISPLRAWLSAHASSSLSKFQQLEVAGYHQPLIFQAETAMRKFVAYIDPEDRFAVADKLSQVNCLQQMQNIASYGFLKKRLETHDLHIHALWFDIYTGDIYYFSRQNKRFVEISETTFPKLEQEIMKYYT